MIPLSLMDAEHFIKNCTMSGVCTLLYTMAIMPRHLLLRKNAAYLVEPLSSVAVTGLVTGMRLSHAARELRSSN